MTTIDLNSDIGEGFGQWVLGDDPAMLEIVTSANIACGFHAGDSQTIRTTAQIATERGVSIGAHVAYRDLAGFGRRKMDVASEDLIADVIYQIGALKGLAASVGGTVRYVKPHGALYNTIARDERQATDVVTAVKAVDPELTLLGLPDSIVLEVAESAGLATAREAFADRAYNADGTLVARSEDGAVLHDADEVAERMVQLVAEGGLTAADGSWLELQADSICVHGDSPGAQQMAFRTAERLREAGLTMEPFAA